MRPIDADALSKAVEASQNINPHKDLKVASNHMYEHRHFLRLIAERPTVLDEDAVKKLADYEAIGTVDEFRYLRKKATIKCIKAKKCGQCEREFCEADCDRNFNRCPNCDSVLDTDYEEQYPFCPYCGQRLRWDMTEKEEGAKE